MTALGRKGDGIAIEIDRLLGQTDGGRRLERHRKEHRLAVGDAALHPAAVVGGRFQAAVDGHEGIVVNRALEPGAGKPRTDLEPFGGGYREHGLGQLGLELVEDRLTPAGRHLAAHAGDHAADTVLGLLGPGHQGFHFGGGGRVRAAHPVAVHRLPGDLVDVDRRRRNVADGADPGDDLDAIDLVEHLFHHGAGGHAADGFARAGAAAARSGADAVFGLIGVVGMGRPGDPAHLPVVAGPLVAVGHEKADGRAQGEAVFHARKNGHPVRLLAVGGQFALARPAAVQLRLDVRFAEPHAGRATVEDGAHALAVGFAEGGDF